MTVQMIGAVRQLFGDEGIDRLIGVREAAMRAHHQAMLGASCATGWSGWRSCAAPRATWPSCAATAPASCSLKTTVQSVLRQKPAWALPQLELFREVLGEGARVERVEHILADAQRCAYRVSAAD